MGSICLVLPYFGKFHPYFKFWLASCARNPTVNFLVFTDDHTEYDYPENIKVIHCSFSDFRLKMQRAFDFKISLERPYKLCDYKPIYGFALQEHLKGYDFWGHCDCDLVFGDLRHFLTDEILNQYDHVLVHGHLSLYRNTRSVNEMFMMSANGVFDWREVVTTDRPFAFDEWSQGGGVPNIWVYHAPEKQYNQIIFEDVSWVKKRFVSNRRITEDFQKGVNHVCYQYLKGRLYRAYLCRDDELVHRDEIAYVHFQKRDFCIEVDNVDEYLIVPNAFVRNCELTPSFMRMKCRGALIYPKYFKVRWNNLKRKIRECRGGRIV